MAVYIFVCMYLFLLLLSLSRSSEIAAPNRVRGTVYCELGLAATPGLPLVQEPQSA